MSLRPQPVSSHTRLQHVLQAGLHVSTNAAGAMPPITIEGVTVSTNPNHWTGLSLNQIVRLKLVPVDMNEFNRKGTESLAARQDPNSAYDGTEFKSSMSSPYKNWRF